MATGHRSSGVNQRCMDLRLRGGLVEHWRCDSREVAMAAAAAVAVAAVARAEALAAVAQKNHSSKHQNLGLAFLTSCITLNTHPCASPKS